MDHIELLTQGLTTKEKLEYLGVVTGIIEKFWAEVGQNNFFLVFKHIIKRKKNEFQQNKFDCLD